MKKITFLIFLLALFTSCKHGKDNENALKDSIKLNVDENVTVNVSNTLPENDSICEDNENQMITSENAGNISCKVFEEFQIPSPSEFIFDIKKTQPDFDLLYAIKKPDVFENVYTKSMVLGIYSADLIYAAAYENFNYVNSYYKNALTFAYDLGISESFTSEDFEKITNSDNYDSTLQIIDKAIQNTCIQLDESNAYEELPFIIYGGWLEAVYLLANTIINNPESDDILYKELANQKDAIDNLISYYNQILVNTDDYDINLNIQNIIGELKDLKQVFDNVYIASKFIISADDLENIDKKLKEIRSSITQSAEVKIEIQQQRRIMNAQENMH